MAQLQAQLKRQSVERDSLDLDRGDDDNASSSSNDKQLSNYQTQLATLRQEHDFAQKRIEHIVGDFNQLLETIYKKRFFIN